MCCVQESMQKKNRQKPNLHGVVLGFKYVLALMFSRFVVAGMFEINERIEPS